MKSVQNYIKDIISGRLEEISGYHNEDKKVRLIRGKLTGRPFKPDYDDSTWGKKELPQVWETGNDVWFRKKIIVPDEIKGINPDGSRLEVSGPGYFGDSIAIAHGEMFIDDRKIFESFNWTDFRYRYLISEKVSPGDIHFITIHFYKRNDYIDSYPRYLQPLQIHYDKIDNIIFELGSFIKEIEFARFLKDPEKILEKILREYDAEEFKRKDYKDLLKVIESIRNKLVVLKPEAKKYKVKLIGHAHIDMNWLWPMDETEDVVKNTFDTVLDLMKKYPELHFSQSQAYTYKLAEEKFPEIFEGIGQKVREGNWDITASTWVELDLNMSGGESIVRQILYSKRYIKEKFGFIPEIFWAPDTFGHPWSMPQILQKSGLKFYYFMRASYRDDDLFWWQGLDGSKVLAFNSRYIAEINLKDICDIVELAAKNQKTITSMYVYGIGDHGGGPTAKDIEIARRINEKPLLPSLEFSSTHDFFNSILKQNLTLPLRDVEFNPVCDGCYTTHWDTKVHNRKCQKLLLESETLNTILKILGFNCSNLENFWKATLFNQFHDILPGSAIKPSYDYSNKIAAETEENCNNIILENIEKISGKVRIKNFGDPVMVFNNLSWERNDIAELDFRENLGKTPQVVDGESNIYPSQVIDGKIVFIAEEIPAMGYKVFYITSTENNPDKSDKRIITEKYRMENEFYIMEIDGKTGLISYLYDKKNNRIVMKLRLDEGAESDNAFPQKLRADKYSNSIPLTAVSMNNVLQVLYEKPHLMSAWVIGPIGKTINLIDNPEIEILSNGPVLGVIRIKSKFNKSLIIRDIKMYKGIKRIDFDTKICWQEKSGPEIDAPMVKVSFAPILEKTRARFEIPFGSIERIANGREFPALNWVDISDDDYGLSILSDTKHGFSANGNTVTMTMIRTSYEPDPEADRGEHNFTYSIYPHSGDFKKSGTVRKGYELNHKLIKSYFNGTDGKEMPDEKGFISINKPDVILTAFKIAEDGNGLIIRVYESIGINTDVIINLGFGISKAMEVNLVEETLENKNLLEKNRIAFKIKPFEIKTFRLEWL